MSIKNKPYKIIHIASYVNGGAGTAAYRIHEALLENGCDSAFLSLDKAAEKMKGCYQLIKPRESLFARLGYQFKKLFPNRIEKQRNEIIKELQESYASLNCELASLPFSDFDLINHPKVESADIIHLHWITGIIDYPSFFTNIKKPLIWTFHDMNPIKGLYHYEEDEMRNQKTSGRLNKKVEEIKKESIKNCVPSLVYVAPSKWLFHKAAGSKLFGQCCGYHIEYTVNTEVFRPLDYNNLREQLFIPPEHTILLFVSQYINNYRKGFALLQLAMDSVQENVTLLIIGNATGFKMNNANIRILGKVEDNDLLCQYYCLADALILPSREDNLPNVMLEALACGTPILSFDVGGMASVISNYFNGLKAKEISVDGLVHIIKEFVIIRTTFNREVIRNFAVSHFSPQFIASKYYEVYTSLLN